MDSEKLVDVVAEALLRRRGFAFVTNPMDEGQDAYDLTIEALYEARAAVRTVVEECAGRAAYYATCGQYSPLVAELARDIESSIHSLSPDAKEQG